MLALIIIGIIAIAIWVYTVIDDRRSDRKLRDYSYEQLEEFSERLNILQESIDKNLEAIDKATKKLDNTKYKRKARKCVQTKSK